MGRQTFFASLVVAVPAATFSLPAAAEEAPPRTFTEKPPGAIGLSVEIDQNEFRFSGDDVSYGWDGEAEIGTEINKFVLKSEGEQDLPGELEEAEVQFLYGRNVFEGWDAQVGFRQVFRPTPQRSYGVVAAEGTVDWPIDIDVEPSLFIDEDGVLARLELTSDVLQVDDVLDLGDLVLQAHTEMNFAAQEIEALGLGSGLTELEAGLRLRYEVLPVVAPYIGVHYEREFFGTADFTREEGEDVDSVSFVLGLYVEY